MQQPPGSQQYAQANWNRLWHMHMTTMSPQQLAALQQSLHSHPTATPDNGAAHISWGSNPYVGVAAPAATNSQQLRPTLQGQQQQKNASASSVKLPTSQQASDARMHGHDQARPQVDAGPSMHGEVQGLHPTVVHGQMVTQQQPAPAADEAEMRLTAGGSSQQLPVLEGRPVDAPPAAAAAVAALAAEEATLAERIPVADASAFAQQQAQLYYAIVAEEAGNVRHDLHALVGASGLWGDTADAAVDAGLRSTAAGTARAAVQMLERLNEAETGELLSTILSDPVELDWQQLLLESAQCNREHIFC